MKKAEEKLIGMVMLLGARCRCGHEWLPRESEKPRVCPKCKSANWDRPKRWQRKPE
jgi:predicted Zn-ribbon and HTH transcriptional regulator